MQFLNGIIIAIALLHLWIVVLEMFLWQHPIGLKAFRLNKTFAQQSARLAANQGLYNGFLCAGLLWSVFAGDPVQALQLKWFFLSCVALAGIFGGISVNKRIFVIQGIPAIVALLLTCYLF